MANSGAPGNGVSWTPLHDLEGIITPNGLHFERHHNGVPLIAPKNHQLLIHGLVKTPLLFNMDALLRYPMTSTLCFIEYVTQIGVKTPFKPSPDIFMVWQNGLLLKVLMPL